MEKQVFLAIFVFALVKFQGINGSAIITTTPIPGCSCDTMLDPNALPPRQFAFVATVTHRNFTPHVVPVGYNSIIVYVQQLCAGKMPYKRKARLNTLTCPEADDTFTDLRVNQHYFFYGTYKYLLPDYRRSFVVDRCGPPCSPNRDVCPLSLDQCRQPSLSHEE